ncbi:flagellar basal body-associated FliL family protein [Candidatus Puniceispirillum sp.]|nr:flagellar basal body-associated FliL family protein [Candidatus Puniceispirillum sp.]
MDDAELSPTQSGKLQRFLLPLTILGCVTIVLTLFAIGYLTLTTPETPPEDINAIIRKVTAEPNGKTTSDEAVEDGETEQSTQLSDGQFDFDRHRYYSFPLPFVSNLASGKGMLTVEIAIATYGNTLTGEAVIKELESFNPKIRSAINLRLAQQKLADIDSVEKRKKLTSLLLDDIKLIVDKPDTKKPSAITDVHFVKFVISEAF